VKAAPERGRALAAVLSYGWAYDLAQYLLGASRTRRWLQRDFMQARAGERVLDVGCGTADILSVLPDGLDYVGCDVSERYIARARARWGHLGRFYVQDVDDVGRGSPGGFDLILATGLLHHLDDAQASLLFQTLATALNPGGRIVTVDCCFVERQNRIARFLIEHDRGQYVRTPQKFTALAQAALPDVRGWLVHRRWVPYTYWIMRARHDA